MVILKSTKKELNRLYLLLANTKLTNHTLCSLQEISSLPFSEPMHGALHEYMMNPCKVRSL